MPKCAHSTRQHLTPSRAPQDARRSSTDPVESRSLRQRILWKAYVPDKRAICRAPRSPAPAEFCSAVARGEGCRYPRRSTEGDRRVALHWSALEAKRDNLHRRRVVAHQSRTQRRVELGQVVQAKPTAILKRSEEHTS